MNAQLIWRRLPLLILLLLLGFALRLFQLEAQSIWWDEGISLHLATSSLETIFRNRLDNIHPPLYFAALKGWVSLVGVSPFAARYSSVLASWLQIALIWGYGRALVGRRSGGRQSSITALPWLAAGLMTISAVSVIYGQEIRVYAFLPLVYIGMLWTAERIVLDDDVSWRPVALLAAVIWLGLHLHYIALFGAAYVGTWGASSLIRRRGWTQLGRFVAAFVLAGLASLPWFLAVLGNWAAVQAEASAGTFATEAVPVPFLIAQVWAFQLTGLAGALASPAVQALALAAAVLLAALLVSRLAARSGDDATRDQASTVPTIPPAGRADLWRQLAHWAVPLSAAFLLWSLRSFSHPRYTIMFTIAFIPLVAGLAYPLGKRWAGQMVVGGLLTCVVTLSFWGLGRYFFDSGAAKADMRSVAAYLEEEAVAGDVILIPDTDWSLPFEYDGPATIMMVALGESADALSPALQEALACEKAAGSPADCAAPRMVFAVDYERGTRDWQDRLPFELERRGSLVNSAPVDELRVDAYVVNQAAAPLSVCDSASPPLARYGELLLHDAWIEQTAAADSALTVALCWSVDAAVDLPISTSLALTDPAARRDLARADAPLLDSSGRPTSLWAPGAPVLTYHVLPLPVGAPPLAYELSATAYGLSTEGDVRPLELIDQSGAPGGQSARLGNVSLQPGDPDISNPYRQPDPSSVDGPVSLGPLRLRGGSVSPGPFQPGQNVAVDLLWAGPTDLLAPDLQPAVVLRQGDTTLAEAADAPVQGRFPTGQWPVGEDVAEVRFLTVPAGATGTARVEVVLGEQRVLLDERELVDSGGRFDAPTPTVPVEVPFGDVATLVGFDVPTLTNPNDSPLPVTLYWRAERDDVPQDYVVFAQLLDKDGRLIAQQDSMAGDGQRPPTAWLAGEYITDSRALLFREADFTGPASIAVGLYEPATGIRLTIPGGADAFRLPVDLTIEAAASPGE